MNHRFHPHRGFLTYIEIHTSRFRRFHERSRHVSSRQKPLTDFHFTRNQRRKPINDIAGKAGSITITMLNHRHNIIECLTYRPDILEEFHISHNVAEFVVFQYTNKSFKSCNRNIERIHRRNIRRTRKLKAIRVNRNASLRSIRRCCTFNYTNSIVCIPGFCSTYDDNVPFRYGQILIIILCSGHSIFQCRGFPDRSRFKQFCHSIVLL